MGEADAIEQLPPWLWQNLVEVVHDMDTSATSLRNRVLTSVRVSMSYLEQEVYDQLHRGFLRATQGDAVEFVDSMRGLDEPPGDDVASKALHCCCMFVPHDTAQVINLLRDTACSIVIVEQGHAAGALIRRQHLLVGSQGLSAKAYIAEVRPLVRPHPIKQQLAKLKHS